MYTKKNHIINAYIIKYIIHNCMLIICKICVCIDHKIYYIFNRIYKPSILCNSALCVCVYQKLISLISSMIDRYFTCVVASSVVVSVVICISAELQLHRV